MKKKGFKPDHPLTVGRKWLLVLTAFAVLVGGVQLLGITSNTKIFAEQYTIPSDSSSGEDSNTSGTASGTVISSAIGNPKLTVKKIVSLGSANVVRFTFSGLENLQDVSKATIFIDGSIQTQKDKQDGAGVPLTVSKATDGTDTYVATSDWPIDGGIEKYISALNGGTSSVILNMSARNSSDRDMEYTVPFYFDATALKSSYASGTSFVTDYQNGLATAKAAAIDASKVVEMTSKDITTDNGDEVYKQCADYFKKKDSWFGGTIGRVFCWLSRMVGDGLTIAIKKTFNIEDIIKNHSHSSLDGNRTDDSGNKIGTPWALNIWNTLIKLTDILAVLILIIVAFANILRININVYTVKKLLPAFIGSLVVAHLSFFLIRAIFAISSAIVPSSFTDVINSGISNLSQVLSGILVTLIIGFLINPLPLILASLVIVGVVLLMCLVGMLLVLQPIIVSVLTMFAPVAILCYVLPQTRSYFEKWMRYLMNWIFMWPLTMFLLYLVAQIVKETQQGPIMSAIMDIINFVGGESASSATVTLFTALAPFLIATMLFALAARLPFMLGKDVIALANSAKQGLQALQGAGASAVNKVGYGARRIGETVQNKKQGWENWQNKRARADVLRSGNVAVAIADGDKSARAEKYKEIITSASHDNRRKRIAASLLEEEEGRNDTFVRERLSLEGGEEIARIRDSGKAEGKTDEQIEEEVSRERKRLEVQLSQVGVNDTENARAEIKQQHQRNAQSANMTLDEYMSSEDEGVKRSRKRTEEEVAERYGGVTLAKIRGFEDQVPPRPWLAGKLKTEEATGAETWVGAQKLWLRNAPINASNGLMRSLYNFTNSVETAVGTLETAAETAKARDEQYKTERREKYLGTRVFEKLAGPQVAGKTTAAEYAEKYRFWQYPELLEEVRRLRMNLSSAQIAEIIQQSPRKAWPMALRYGYTGGLDNFSKLYMAANYMKSAGRSYGARATFEDMLNTGMTAHELEMRTRSNNTPGENNQGVRPAQGAFTEEDSNTPGLLNRVADSGPSNTPQTVRLETRSAQLLARRIGEKVSPERAQAIIRSLGDRAETASNEEVTRLASQIPESNPDNAVNEFGETVSSQLSTLDDYAQALREETDAGTPKTVALQRQSARILSELMGVNVSSEMATQMLAVVGPHFSMTNPEQLSRMEAVRSDTSITTDQKVARMITEIRASSRGVGSADINIAVHSTDAAAKAWQAYRSQGNQSISLEEARRQLQDLSHDKLKSQIGIITPKNMDGEGI